MYAPLFSVESQYLGAEKTVGYVRYIHELSQTVLTGYAFAVVLDFVTFHPDLMRPNNGFQAIVVAELFRHIRAEL